MSTQVQTQSQTRNHSHNHSHNQPQTGSLAPSKPTATDLPGFVHQAFALLGRTPYGHLSLTSPTGQLWSFGQGKAYESHVHQAHIHIHDWRIVKLAMQSGDIGFAEGYRDGLWSSPDVAAVLRYFLANRQHVEGIIYGTWWGGLLYKLKHLLHRNSRAQAKKNIHAHYDLGNAFYREWLDESMNYSSAWFAGDLSADLHVAQDAKMRRALQACGVESCSQKTSQNVVQNAVQNSPQTPRILEIGCGWGAVAELAAREFGVHTTGVTLSTEQLYYAQDRLNQAQLGDKADLRLQDYRDLSKEFAATPFDAIVSIEMFEAVGKAYWPSYFETLHTCLKPGAKACIQTITIDKNLYERYLSGTDFIQQYIFPGGCLPSLEDFCEHAERAGLRVVDRFSLRLDYAETLRRWRLRFMAQGAQIRPLGFDDTFFRLWEFYLAYCEAAFDMNSTNVWQVTLEKKT